MSYTTNNLNPATEQGEPQAICTSLIEISNGKGRPLPRRLILTPTHLIIQKNVAPVNCNDDVDSTRPTHGSVSDRGLSGDGSFDSFNDTDTQTTSPPPERNKREVTLTRIEGVLGISVRGGAEHGLPLIVSRLLSGSPASLCKQIYIGDAILSINGVKIKKMDHDSAVHFLSSAGPTVTLKLKYFSTAKPYLSPTQQSLLESNINQWDACDRDDGAIRNEQWETEKTIPLIFGLLTRYMSDTDRLRYNSFEVRDSTNNISSGIIHCGNTYILTYWIKYINDTILGLNNVQIKLWSQETQNEIFYVGWVWEGSPNKSEDDGASEATNYCLDDTWICWKPKILAIRGMNIYYMNYPPGVGGDWDGGQIHPLISTLLRVLTSADEFMDERQHCFSLQIAIENENFPPKGIRTAPITLYLNTETRQELIKIETAWNKAITTTVKAIKKCSFTVWWGGKPCQLELDFPSSSFNLYRSSSKPSTPLWSRLFASLKGSSDDSRTRLTLKFHGNFPSETMECRDLHRVLFTIHSFLLAKVIP